LPLVEKVVLLKITEDKFRRRSPETVLETGARVRESKLLGQPDSEIDQDEVRISLIVNWNRTLSETEPTHARFRGIQYKVDTNFRENNREIRYDLIQDVRSASAVSA